MIQNTPVSSFFGVNHEHRPVGELLGQKVTRRMRADDDDPLPVGKERDGVRDGSVRDGSGTITSGRDGSGRHLCSCIHS